jgi:hypothetical protein
MPQEYSADIELENAEDEDAAEGEEEMAEDLSPSGFLETCSDSSDPLTDFCCVIGNLKALRRYD